MVTLRPSFFFYRIFILSGNEDNHKIFGKTGPWNAELPALERLKKSQYTNKGGNVVATLASSFLIGSSSFLQV